VQNYLYCLDENYNIQGSISIFSLLSKSSETVNIYILHKNPSSFEKYLKIISTKLKNVNFFIYKFDKTGVNFPNIKDTHVSEATYYRFFIDEFLPADLKEVMYIDADIVCMKSLTNSYRKEIKKLKESDFIISAKTEFSNDEELYGYHDEFNRLEMKGSKYFNAGVMFIDLEKWRKARIQNKLLDKQNTLNRKIQLWDQDVLNSYFDGKYIELDKYLNYVVNIWIYIKDFNHSENISPKEISNIYLLHYAGKSKPWTVKGAIHPTSDIYQEGYRKLFNKKYHINSNWKIIGVVDFISILTSKYFFKVKYKFSYIFHVLKYLFSKQ
jgi:lipopolysaccharide biosynthesis glycosyltransferase